MATSSATQILASMKSNKANRREFLCKGGAIAAACTAVPYSLLMKQLLACDAITASPSPGLDTLVITPTKPRAYSGIYPHTAVTSTHYEVGIGGIVRRGDKLYYMTYGPHLVAGGSDKLYMVDTTDLSQTKYLDYPGNTDANRYVDTYLQMDIVGAAYIDAHDTIRFLPVTKPGDLRGRITGTAAHLTNHNKLYYMTMEEGLYEVDFSDLDNPVITTLRVDGNESGGGGSHNLPGVHGKGLYTAQGVLLYTNNGAGDGGRGVLAEWDGVGDPEQLSSWTIVDGEAQYTEVTSRRGPSDMDPASNDPVWATGWDDVSLFINVRDATTDHWTKFRLPKASYTHGHPSGWYTEWPRIRDVGLRGGCLMSHHGMMFLVPKTLSADNPSRITPLATHHKMIVDYVEIGDQIVFAADDASKFDNSFVAQANSNIMFVEKAKLVSYGGSPSGFGGVWLNASISANDASDPFLINGFTNRVLHFKHQNPEPVEFTLEADLNGDGTWTPHATVSIPGNATGSWGYGFHLLPETLDAQWVRIRPKEAVSSLTVYLHLSNDQRRTNELQLARIAKPTTPARRSQGLLRSTAGEDYELEFAADSLDADGELVDTGYYRARLHPKTYQLNLVAVNDPVAEAAVRSQAATTQDFVVDAASVVINDGGAIYRLPKGNPTFDTATASGWRRGKREVVTERSIMNVHGTIFELPRDFEGGGIRRIRPITTHNLEIFDFASWRGMLVISGVIDGGAVDGHYVESDDGKVGLWFGNVDDLWTFGAPRGEGGPWKDTAVSAGVASDPYLMTGYDQKRLDLSHTSETNVICTIEIDFLGTGRWEHYGSLSVSPGETLTHVFEDGYSAHWVRLIPDTRTTATAWFTYKPNVALSSAEADQALDAGTIDG